MYCPKCANEITNVIGSHTRRNYPLRFRICPKCDFAFLTKEIVSDRKPIKLNKKYKNKEIT